MKVRKLANMEVKEKQKERKVANSEGKRINRQQTIKKKNFVKVTAMARPS